MMHKNQLKQVLLAVGLCSLAGCGQNFGIEKEQAYNQRMKDEVDDMRDEMRAWAERVEDKVEAKKAYWNSLPAEERAAKKDSVARFVGAKIDSSAVALEAWIKTNGPEAKQAAKGYASDLSAWAKDKENLKKLGKKLSNWADKLADDAKDVAKNIQKDFEDK